MFKIEINCPEKSVTVTLCPPRPRDLLTGDLRADDEGHRDLLGQVLVVVEVRDFPLLQQPQLVAFPLQRRALLGEERRRTPGGETCNRRPDFRFCASHDRTSRAKIGTVGEKNRWVFSCVYTFRIGVLTRWFDLVQASSSFIRILQEDTLLSGRPRRDFIRQKPTHNIRIT